MAGTGGGAARVLLAHVRTRLVEAGLDEHAEIAARLVDADPAPPRPHGADPAVLGRLGEALTVARSCAQAEIADAVASLGAGVAWTQTEGYVADPPSAGFLDGYAHTTLLGSPDGAGATTVAGASLGLLLLAAGIDYPPHHHPADEVYLPLTPARWTHGRHDAYRPEPPGVPIHHEPWQPHGMRTDAGPLLAVHLWSGDVSTSSRFC